MAVSVKLDETLRARLKVVGGWRGRSPHSMMWHVTVHD